MRRETEMVELLPDFHGDTQAVTQSEEPKSYVGRKQCGCLVFAVVDVPGREKETAKDVAEAIRDGLTIERVTTEYVRVNFTSCKCASGHQGVLELHSNQNDNKGVK